MGCSQLMAGTGKLLSPMEGRQRQLDSGRRGGEKMAARHPVSKTLSCRLGSPSLMLNMGSRTGKAWGARWRQQFRVLLGTSLGSQWKTTGRGGSGRSDKAAAAAGEWPGIWLLPAAWSVNCGRPESLPFSKPTWPDNCLHYPHFLEQTCFSRATRRPEPGTRNWAWQLQGPQWAPTPASSGLDADTCRGASRTPRGQTPRVPLLCWVTPRS